MTEVIRSLGIKIRPLTERKKNSILLTMRRYRKCANFHIEMMKELGVVNKKELHSEFYRYCKNIYSLPGCIVQIARDKAVEAYKARISNRGGFPRLRSDSLRLNHNTFGLINRDGKWFVGILTVDGRVYLPLASEGALWDEVEKKANTIKGGELVLRNGTFYLNLFIKQKVKVMRWNEAEHVVAVDRGVNNIATVVVTNRNGELVHAKFFSGAKHGWKRKHNYEVRKSLQESKLLNKVKDIKDREKRYMRDVDHKISKEIVDIARKFPKSVIVLEDLKNIRQKVKYSSRQNRRIHNWSFDRLGSYTDYKATSHGIPVLGDVWAAYSTRYHRQCGSINTVRDRHILHCEPCGYVVNADFNGAYNLSLRGWRVIGHAPVTAGCSESSPQRLRYDDVSVMPQHQINDLRSPFPSGSG